MCAIIQWAKNVISFFILVKPKQSKRLHLINKLLPTTGLNTLNLEVHVVHLIFMT